MNNHQETIRILNTLNAVKANKVVTGSYQDATRSVLWWLAVKLNKGSFPPRNISELALFLHHIAPHVPVTYWESIAGTVAEVAANGVEAKEVARNEFRKLMRL